MLSHCHKSSGCIKSALRKVVIFVFTPILLAFFLVSILFTKTCRITLKWISNSITALRAFFAVIGRSKMPDSDEVSDKTEFTGFVFDSSQNIFLSKMDAWQRNFGYCRLYDEAASPLGMIVDSEPIYFEYGGKNWLIELWKGQYDLTTGCEIGIYTTSRPILNIPGVFNFTLYNSGSNSDRLRMSFTLKKNDKILFTREDKHWWLTGFKIGEFSEPSELTMKITINFKDENMCNAFIKGLHHAGYPDNKITKYGNAVCFIFDKPYAIQPFSRIKITDWIIQKKNKYMCTKYQDITSECNNMQEKLKVIQEKAPRIYKKVINIGKTLKFYRKCRKINNLFK